MDSKVTSEIYFERDYISHIKPTFDGNVVSVFKYTIPKQPKIDRDGDIKVQRRTHDNDDFEKIEIEHSTSTALNLVGLQIWRGALLLADWLIYNSKILPKDSVILELGSGVGLTSIVASMFRPVLCTDIDEGGILSLLESNVNRNQSLVKHAVTISGLNFFTQNIRSEILSILPNVKIILAADVIYDNDITFAFVNTIRKLLSYAPESTIYVALEKRYIFVQSECGTCAPCYEYFLECLQQYTDIKSEEVVLDFPQYFVYERVKELVLWKINLSQ